MMLRRQCCTRLRLQQIPLVVLLRMQDVTRYGIEKGGGPGKQRGLVRHAPRQTQRPEPMPGRSTQRMRVPQPRLQLSISSSSGRPLLSSTSFTILVFLLSFYKSQSFLSRTATRVQPAKTSCTAAETPPGKSPLTNDTRAPHDKSIAFFSSQTYCARS